MKKITMSNFGANGRLGNQLFQYASLIGLAKKFNAELKLPAWPYAKYFEGEFPTGYIAGREVKETVYHYVPDWPAIREHEVVDINGYLQSDKYWLSAMPEVTKAFTFKKEFVQQVVDQHESNNDRLSNPIAISIRRGDYVNNPNYVQLPVISYYFLALQNYFPDWRTRQIIIFSDDIPYCRVHFGCLTNVTFSENNSDIEDICLMSQCKDFIIANSTFAWWGAYLSQLQRPDQVKIVRSKHHFDGRLKIKNDSKDLYPAEWQIWNCFDTNGHYKKVDLSDVTFTVPVAYDHEHRAENLNMLLRVMQKNFNTEISVGEAQTAGQEAKFNYLDKPDNHYHSDWYFRFEYKKFHRTRMLNIMARAAQTKFIFNWDADVLIAPIQIFMAVEALRNGADMVYPYRWAFARMPREIWFTKIRDYEDIGMVGDTRFNGMNVGDAVSLGGAVGFNRDSFLKCGGENENFISYGAEDVERNIRFKKLGARVERVAGENLYHMNHYVGPNSCPRHEDFANNDKELKKVRAMSTDELNKYISTWTWNK
jgi:hypothetical protein